MNTHVLPSSRLQDATLGSQMVDWELPDGSTVRVEAVKVYCANCGKLYGHAPINQHFEFWLCRKCHEDYGDIAGTFTVPDEEFNRAVQEEMQARFGRDLTGIELVTAAKEGRLGTSLELLARESPYGS